MSASLPAVPQRPSWRLTVAGIAVAGLLGAMTYLLTLSWPVLFPKPVHAAAATPGCDLNTGPCTAAFDATRFIRLRIATTGRPAGEPFGVMVDTAGLDADAVGIEFSGVDMNMGLFRSELDNIGDGSFAGDAVLPVCIRRRMTWRATVAAQGPDGIYRATFEFEVVRR